jgi:putative ABC transport system permease protein
MIEADGTSGNSFVLLAPPAGTPLLDLEVIEGEWLSPQAENGIVLNHSLWAEYPGLQVGDEITLSMLEQAQSWRIMGFVREPASPPSAYIAYADFPGPAGFAQSLLVVTQEHDEASLITAKQNLEDAFSANGIPISTNLNSYDSRKIVEDHAVLITSFLVMAAAMSLVVGGLGLMTTMGINVLERTREIGVMRAIGASNRALLKIILGEGMVIAFLSWLLAAVIVVPMSYQVAQMLGQTMLKTRLDFALDPFGFVIWLAVVVAFSIVAGWLPARNATRFTVRNVLAYE